MGVLTLYRWLIVLLAPLVRWHVAARARQGKEDPARINERWGRPSITPPPLSPGQKRLWVHAASVGEALTALSVIDRARLMVPNLSVIFTTGTVTSARVIAGRLANGVVHQYAPYDHPAWIAHFLDAWHPTAAVRIEAEIWPNTLLALKQRGLPVALLNAHMSEKSYRRWRRASLAARILMNVFTSILADGKDNAERYRALGADHVTVAGNIKFMAPPLPVNETTIQAFKAVLQNRPVWIYASTHADEELIAAHIHTALRAEFPGLLTLIAPRHPVRAASVMTQLIGTGLKVMQRSRAPLPAADTDLYVIDTMGELGTFYAVAPLAVMGRSFSRDGGGGHNPIEPALLGCYPLSGPQVHNVQTIFDTMIAARATVCMPNVETMIDTLRTSLRNPDTLHHQGQMARAHVVSTARHIQQSVDICMMCILKSIPGGRL